MVPFLPTLERLITTAARQIQLLASLSPLDAGQERARLTGELKAGRAAVPCWRYVPVAHDELRRALDAAEQALARERQASPLDRVHLARVRELSLEAALCAAAGRPGLSSLARERFAPRGMAHQGQASELCAAWLAAPHEKDDTPRMDSDAAHPASLLSQLRAEVGRRRLPFTVVVQPSLAPLAATGDQVILVAPGRPVTAADVARTVLHEVEGHVLPRVRARSAPLALFRVGTARGVDEQEGLALLFEERSGRLDARRRRVLAARHRAVEAMASGATFADVTAALLRDHGLPAPEAVLIAERAFRGSDGVREGLGRERVYLESFVRVRAHLTERPEDERVLAAGQVALEAVPALTPFVAAV